ncbi:uncharacterized protein LOC107768152 isoform X2 [Nicotiana tabacum]|uniref:Uncharacterized protein LOC107768152 isoform X2 n=1 Tax=Nicotiana tabacum TaxID=4097 RepID=A0AC58TW15_TOBAC
MDKNETIPNGSSNIRPKCNGAQSSEILDSTWDGAGLVHQMQDKHCNLLTAGSSTFGVVGHGGHLWWSSLEVMKVSVCAVCDEGMSGFHSGSAKTVFLEIFVFLV